MGNFIPENKRYHVDDLYVGDVVKVITDGAMFSTYKTWFDINNSKYRSFWKFSDNSITGKEFIIMEKAKHHQYDDMVYLIQCTNTKRVYLIGRYGLELVKRAYTIVIKESNYSAADDEDVIDSRFEGIL